MVITPMSLEPVLIQRGFMPSDNKPQLLIWPATNAPQGHNIVPDVDGDEPISFNICSHVLSYLQITPLVANLKSSSLLLTLPSFLVITFSGALLFFAL